MIHEVILQEKTEMVSAVNRSRKC